MVLEVAMLWMVEVGGMVVEEEELVVVEEVAVVVVVDHVDKIRWIR